MSESESESKSESVLRQRHNENKTEFWGYVDVRPGAHMFYWLYHSYHPDGYLTRPLIIWLQVRLNNANDCDYYDNKSDLVRQLQNPCFWFL